MIRFLGIHPPSLLSNLMHYSGVDSDEEEQAQASQEAADRDLSISYEALQMAKLIFEENSGTNTDYLADTYYNLAEFHYLEGLV